MTAISTTAGTVRVDHYRDDTPGDEYAAVTLEVAGREVDLLPADVKALISALLVGAGEAWPGAPIV